MNYYERHIGDYLKDTTHLSMLEDGAYNRLLDQYYSRERLLPPGFKDGMMAMVGGKNKTAIRNGTPPPFRDVLVELARRCTVEEMVIA